MSIGTDAETKKRIIAEYGTTDGDTVLRLPVLGLRVCPNEFFDQIVEALIANGCADVIRAGRGSHQNV